MTFPPLRKSLTIAVMFFFFCKEFRGGGVKLIMESSGHFLCPGPLAATWLRAHADLLQRSVASPVAGGCGGRRAGCSSERARAL